MKHNVQTSTAGYSSITAIMMIGFLLVLTVSTFNLVLQELNDGKGRENYMKAYAGAEGAMELALLQIKQQGYGFYKQEDDLEYFGLARKNGLMSYDIDSETNTYTGSLMMGKYSTDIIPLFVIVPDTTAPNTFKTQGVSGNFKFTDIDSKGLIWNVIGENGGVSGVGDFTQGKLTVLRTIETGNKFGFRNIPISDLLQTNSKNYLTVFNPTGDTANYKLETAGDILFTKPKSVIKSSSQVGGYSQNLDTMVDNSEFLGILKYSIYSGD